MTLKELGIPDLVTLEAMSDEDIAKHFAQFIEVCRPKVKISKEPKVAKPKVIESDEDKVAMDKLKQMAEQFGFKGVL